MWQPDEFTGDCRELYELVIPECDRVDERQLLERFPDRYQLWSYRLEGKLVALALIFFMPVHQTLHLDVVAVHPDFRHRGWSVSLWQSLLDSCGRARGCSGLSIEAYPYNVDYFLKCGFSRTVPYVPIWTQSATEWLVTAPRSPDLVREMIEEWQSFERSWGQVGYLY